MNFDPVGIGMAAIMLFICCFGRQAAICAAFGCMAFSACGVFSLTALGGASVTLPQFGLLVLLGIGLGRDGALGRAGRAVAEDKAVKLLVGFTVIAVLGAMFLPRYLNWKVEVYSIDRFLPDRTNLVSLVPSTGNISQSLYFLGGVTIFFVVIMVVRSETDIRQCILGLKTLIVLHATLACIDALSKYGFSTDSLAFLRTANYDKLTDGDIAGVWRITGAYSEASLLATATAGQMAFCFGFWRSGQGGRFFPVMFAVLASILVLSTSSSAYVFLAFCGLWLMLLFGIQFAQRRFDRAVIILGLALPCMIAVVAALVSVFATVEVTTRAHEFVNQLLFDKMATVSGRERSAWNHEALTNLMDTFGIGAGLGSTKTSSWPLALLSQTGLAGAALYGAFLVLLVAPGTWFSRSAPLRFIGLHAACKANILGMIVAASISWSYIDLGLVFNVMAGLAVCLPHRDWYSGTTAGRLPRNTDIAWDNRTHASTNVLATRAATPIRHPGRGPI